MAKGCLGCHSPHGEGAALSLRGMEATAIYSSLNSFASGDRANSTMNEIARTLSYLERQAVADYLAALP